jgi:hypothetical protein
MGKTQFDLSFEAGMLEQFPAFREVVHASVSGCGRPLKAVAADLDMTSSELSRKLSNNPNDPVHFPLDRLPELIAATGDLRPIYWLIEAFLHDADAKRKRDLEELSALIPRLQRLVHSVGTEAGANGRS